MAGLLGAGSDGFVGGHGGDAVGGGIYASEDLTLTDSNVQANLAKLSPEDRALAAYATQVLGTVRPGERGRARADAPGRRPVYVQASIVRRAVTPYGTTLRPEPTELTLGARPPVGMPGPIR